MVLVFSFDGDVEGPITAECAAVDEVGDVEGSWEESEITEVWSIALEARFVEAAKAETGVDYSCGESCCEGCACSGEEGGEVHRAGGCLYGFVMSKL